MEKTPIVFVLGHDGRSFCLTAADHCSARPISRRCIDQVRAQGFGTYTTGTLALPVVDIPPTFGELFGGLDEMHDEVDA